VEVGVDTEEVAVGDVLGVVEVLPQLMRTMDKITMIPMKILSFFNSILLVSFLKGG